MIAVQVSTCDELLATELVFSGMLNELEPSRLAALLSCLLGEGAKGGGDDAAKGGGSKGGGKGGSKGGGKGGGKGGPGASPVGQIRSVPRNRHLYLCL